MSPDILVFFFVFPLMGANPIGFAPISGMWRKVFVKALPNRISLIKFLFGG